MLWTKLVFVLLPLVYNVNAADDFIKWGLSQKPENIKVINMLQDPSLPLDLSTLSAIASPDSTVFVVLLNGYSEKPYVKTDEDSNTKVLSITTPQPPTVDLTVEVSPSPSYIELPARHEPRPIQKVVDPAHRQPIALIAPKPSLSWTSTKRPQPVQTIPPPQSPTTEPVLILRKEATVESRPTPAPVKVTEIVSPSKDSAKSQPVIKEPVIIPSKRKTITIPNIRREPEESKIIVEPKPEKATKAPAIIVEPKPTPAPAKPVVVHHPPAASSAPVIIPSKRKTITLPNRREPEESKIIVAPKPEKATKAPAIMVEPKPTPAPAKRVVEYHPLAATPAPPASKVVALPALAKPKSTNILVDQKPNPTPTLVAPTIPPSILSPSSKSLLPSPTTLVPSQLFDYSCNDANGYYGVANECDAYVECKKHAASKFTCPEGLHFNPNAIWPEYPCGYPSEVQCEINAVKQEPMPSSECPHQYGYYALADDCGKYVMCQEGLAIVMICPAGLVFNDVTSTCDWPENVPTCNPEIFDGLVCPSPPTDEYDDLMDVIYNYRYGQSCQEYVACLHGRPRLLSCDPGYSFDEDSQICVDSVYVQGCTS